MNGAPKCRSVASSRPSSAPSMSCRQDSTPRRPPGRRAERPKLGTTVMAVGSPLGLDGTISIGVVSGYRSLGGSNYLQFTAAISPGNSGGPVIDSRGRVVAIASAKLVYPGAEALSLGIPVAVACDSLVVCGPG